MEKIGLLYYEMIKYYENDPKRIAHFVKVHSFARAIAAREGLDKNMQFLIETAALVHDIGIKIALAKYNDCSGPYQELEGPAEARKMLERLDYPAEVTDRVCYLVSVHHHYTDIRDIDYQILVEADFLVNFYEDNMSMDQIMQVYDKVFKTDSGRELCELMYKLD